MEYLPGFVHESFMKTKYYQFNMGFNFIICNNVRYSEIEDYDKESYTIELYKDDIICTKVFKYRQDVSAYVYLEGYYRENVYYPINQESIISRDFISANYDINLLSSDDEVKGKLMVDVTKIFERDKKINLILE